MTRLGSSHPGLPGPDQDPSGVDKQDYQCISTTTTTTTTSTARYHEQLISLHLVQVLVLKLYIFFLFSL